MLAAFMATIQRDTTECVCVPGTVNLSAMVLSATHPHSCVYNRLWLWYRYNWLWACVYFRGGAWAGGEATLAIQRLPAGAQWVPAAAPQATQVPLHSHVTPTWMPKSCGEQGEGRAEEGENNDKEWDRSSTEKQTKSFFQFVLLDEGLFLKDIRRLNQ